MYKLKKSLGQNLLIDKNVIKKILSAVNLENQIVFEIGPGHGNLTLPIIEKKIKKIILIEKDEKFCKILKQKFLNYQNIEIYNQDILKFNLDSISSNNVIVFGNLPYNISPQILVNFLKVKKWPPFYKKVIFMFQKEVADRIIAKCNTKAYGRITVLTNFRFEIIKSFNVSKNCFFPKPSVDSKILVFKPKNNSSYKILNIKNLEKITNIFFSNKRKMINKPFSKIFKNPEIVSQKLNIDLSLRPNQINENEFYKIVNFFESDIN